MKHKIALTPTPSVLTETHAVGEAFPKGAETSARFHSLPSLGVQGERLRLPQAKPSQH